METVILGLLALGAGWVVLAVLSERKQRKDLSLSCRSRGCRGVLAQPIGGTNNRYRCPRCRKQFAGSRHGF